MSIKTEFTLEMCKLCRRYVPLLFLMIFAFTTAQTCWCMDDLDITRLNDAGAMLFTNLLLVNTTLCLIVLATLASRMCDMGQMGNTYKWVCTIQESGRAYRGKAVAGSFYIILFAFIQTFLFRVASRSYGGGAASHLTEYFTTTCLTFLYVSIPQLNPSLKLTNRLTPIFINMGGTSTRLFSWFLNRWPLRCLIPQGHYTSLCNMGCTYDKSTCYAACSWDTYPFFWIAVPAVTIIILYRYGQKHSLEMVYKTM